jgi:hypothetical protein
MTAAFFDLGTHPIISAVARIQTELDTLAELASWSLGSSELARLLPQVAKQRSQLACLELGLAHHADAVGLGTEIGAADTGAFWANSTRQVKGIAKHRLKLAAALDRHETTRTAMAAGTVAEDQAAVIIKAVEELPVMQAEAEAHLVRLAAEHDAKALAILARTILEVVAPDIADAHLEKALEREEERALEQCRLTITDDGHGVAQIRGKVPSAVGAMIKKHLLAINAPKHRHHSLTPAGLGHAFCEYVTRYPTHRLPKAGGVNATIVVRMTLDTLLGKDHQLATLETGQKISAGYARKLACEAGLIPMVLGRKSQILDQGRRHRLYTEPQRIAMNHRDKTCTAIGCDWPAWLCHAHHDVPWSKGGKTDLADGRLLCPRHHGYAHSPTYTMTKAKHGRVTFIRR